MKTAISVLVVHTLIAVLGTFCIFVTWLILAHPAAEVQVGPDRESSFTATWTDEMSEAFPDCQEEVASMDGTFVVMVLDGTVQEMGWNELVAHQSNGSDSWVMAHCPDRSV